MTAYAIAHLRNVNLGAEIAEYILKIDATLDPYGGKFLIHGSEPEVVEGPWEGNLVVIAFPTVEHAREWYDSPEYQKILRYRTENSDSRTMIIPGVPEGYQATSFLKELQLN